jgi:hypoxanthine phosphoribosyltransferase
MLDRLDGSKSAHELVEIVDLASRGTGLLSHRRILTTIRNNDVPKMQCELVSWQKYHDLCRDLAIQIRRSEFRPSIIVAIGRGGYMPARLLSDFLGNMNLTSFKIEHYQGAQKKRNAVVKYPLNADLDNQAVLLVDDVSDTGDTFEVAIDHIRQRGRFQSLKTATLHHKQVSKFVPDYYAELVQQWRWIVYPWAVTEDVSSFIAGMGLQSAPANVIQSALANDYGIQLEVDAIETILQLLPA